jgi:hypothetical protein
MTKDRTEERTGWIPGDPIYTEPIPEHVGTTCHLCGTSWTVELSQCPNGCEWEDS